MSSLFIYIACLFNHRCQCTVFTTNMARDQLRSLQVTAPLLLLLLLLGFTFFESEARAMNDLKVEDSTKKMVADKFSLGAIKRSGPSTGGPGHRSVSPAEIQDKGFGHYSFSRIHH